MLHPVPGQIGMNPGPARGAMHTEPQWTVAIQGSPSVSTCSNVWGASYGYRSEEYPMGNHSGWLHPTIHGGLPYYIGVEGPLPPVPIYTHSETVSLYLYLSIYRTLFHCVVCECG